MKISMIEDNEELRREVKKNLILEGYDVKDYANIDEMFSLLEKDDFFPDLVILDPINDNTFNFSLVDKSKIVLLLKNYVEKISVRLDKNVKIIIWSAWDIEGDIKKVSEEFHDLTIIFHCKNWEESLEKLEEQIKRLHNKGKN
jgi:DNA-binding NtrC family response regulator